MLLAGLVKRAWCKVKFWREISRQRNELRRISEHLAKDIGVSRAEVDAEADRHFWDYDVDTQTACHAHNHGGAEITGDDQNCLPV